MPRTDTDLRPLGTRRRWPLAVIGGLAATLSVVLVACADVTEDDSGARSELGAGTRMGALELVTDNIASLERFYTEGVGLERIASDTEEVVLGVAGVELLRLASPEDAHAAPDDVRQAGLYHSAFLYEEDAELASALVRVATLDQSAFQGASDHRVSQAFYFADPDGNGVELYVDRPADTWEWEEGLVVMGSQALDPNAFIAESLGSNLPSVNGGGISMGHTHLRGGDLGLAEEFYESAIGFAVTSRAPGAVFFGADGYHHHLAVNTWSSEGSGERVSTLGLGYVTIVVADGQELAAVSDRLRNGGFDVEDIEGGVLTADPWGTKVRVVAA